CRQRRKRSDTDLTSAFIGELPHFSDEPLHIVQEARSGQEKVLAFLCERYPPSGSIKQPDPDQLFQRLYERTERRLSEVTPPCGAREMPLLCQKQEGPYLPR